MKNLISKAFNSFADGLVIFSIKYGRPSWLIFLFIFALILVLSNPLAGYSSDRTSNCTTDNFSELRGVWLTNIDSQVLFDQTNLAEAIDHLDRLNFNTIYPTVWNWGHTLYPSEVAARVIGHSIDPEPKLQGRDVLKEIVEQAHQKNIAVIPWFEFGFMTPADSELAKRHSDWLTKRHDGNKVWLEGKVHKRVWLNPMRPEVQQFISELILEIASNYQVDGIQLDDHFGFPADFGYDSFTVNLYQQEHNGKLPPANFQDSEWIRWRADKITAYMQQLFAQIKSINPNLIISLSPNPQEFSLESFLLDWHKWEQMGLIEELVLQVYRDDNREFLREIQQPEVQKAKVNIPVAIGILSGLKNSPMSLATINSQVEYTRDQNFSGVSFFFYESLWNLAQETPEQRQLAWQKMFAQSATRPSILQKLLCTQKNSQ